MFKTLIVILMTSVLVNNYVLNRFLGICPFLGVSKKLNQAVGMGVAVIFVMLLATLVTWPIQRFLLEPNDLGYMQTIIFILVIAALVQLVEIILKRYIPSLHKSSWSMFTSDYYELCRFRCYNNNIMMGIIFLNQWLVL